jgi:hypothetical protein
VASISSLVLTLQAGYGRNEVMSAKYLSEVRRARGSGHRAERGVFFFAFCFMLYGVGMAYDLCCMAFGMLS